MISISAVGFKTCSIRKTTCVVAETYGYKSISASAPTLANPGNSFGTAASRVVESSERHCAMLDDSDDDDWPAIGQMVDTRVLAKVEKWNSSGKARPKWSFVMKACDVAVDQQLSGAEISTDVVSNVQLGGVQLYVS